MAGGRPMRNCCADPHSDALCCVSTNMLENNVAKEEADLKSKKAVRCVACFQLCDTVDREEDRDRHWDDQRGLGAGGGKVNGPWRAKGDDHTGWH